MGQGRNAWSNKWQQPRVEVIPADNLLRPMTADDLPLVLQWRNHRAVRKYMFTRREIDLDEHRCWFERSHANPARELLIYEQHHAPMGFVSFDGMTDASIVEWGFYAAPGAARATGRALGRVSLHHAFVCRGRHKVAARTVAANARALSFHAAMGFQQEGRLRDHFFDGVNYDDVICFGLLQTEWQCRIEGH
jgi:UDP-4-amino-4,6-dideoxy-N-acetyl-beta-L-altrosamine N-acetyltransferase